MLENFPNLKELSIQFGAMPQTFGTEAPEKKKFYDDLIQGVPLSSEEDAEILFDSNQKTTNNAMRFQKFKL